MIPLDDLVAQLPRPEGLVSVLSKSDRMDYVSQENDRFVAPNLVELTPCAQPSVILISAPGAVGKSTTAKYIGQVTGAPLWDLSTASVGTNSFTGTVLKTFGATEGGSVLDLLDEGEFLIVLDALDEALMRSGDTNFQAFLTDLRERTRAPRRKPGLVILARTETCDLVEYAFIESPEISYSRYRIDFFDRDSAAEFVRRSISARGRPFTGALQDAQRMLFSLLYSLLGVEERADPWSIPEVRAFLGYAPVLEAIVQYLDVGNPHALVNKLQSATAQDLGSSAPWHILRLIVHDLLQRERDEKVLPALKEQMESTAVKIGWSDWDLLYTPDEQCQRVLAHVTKSALVPTTPAELHESLRPDYDAVVEIHKPDHPFLGDKDGFANVVFRDYLFAAQLVAPEPSMASQVREQLARVDYLPTPLLGRFMLSLSDDPQRVFSIKPKDIGPLYDSLVAQAKVDGDIEIAIRPTSQGADVAMLTNDEGRADVVHFAVDSVLEIAFRRRLAHADIQVNSRVTLGTTDAAFRLGPNVTIECASFACHSPELIVQSTAADGVLIVAESFDQSTSITSEIKNYGSWFGVSWDRMAYPWVDFQVPLLQVSTSDKDLLADLLLLRRVIRRFRSKGYGGLARHSDIINRFAFGESVRAGELRDHMLQQGLMTQSGAMYFLDDKRVGELGINWDALTNAKLSTQVRDFLTGF